MEGSAETALSVPSIVLDRDCRLCVCVHEHLFLLLCVVVVACVQVEEQRLQHHASSAEEAAKKKVKKVMSYEV